MQLQKQQKVTTTLDKMNSCIYTDVYTKQTFYSQLVEKLTKIEMHKKKKRETHDRGMSQEE